MFSPLAARPHGCRKGSRVLAGLIKSLLMKGQEKSVGRKTDRHIEGWRHEGWTTGGRTGHNLLNYMELQGSTLRTNPSR